jgi:hypothetical protein
MDQDVQESTTRDDRAWPKGAQPATLVIGLVLLGGAAALVVKEARPLPEAAFPVLGAIAGASLIVGLVRRWLRGHAMPKSVPLISLALAILAVVLGLPTLLALGGGLMLGNAWCIQLAKANRPPH